MLAHWQPGDVRDVHADMMALTLGVAAKTLFDADTDEDVAEIGQAFNAIADEIAIRNPSPFWIPDANQLRATSATCVPCAGSIAW